MTLCSVCEVLEIEFGVLYVLSRCFTTELCPQSTFYLTFKKKKKKKKKKDFTVSQAVNSFLSQTRLGTRLFPSAGIIGLHQKAHDHLKRSREVW